VFLLGFAKNELENVGPGQLREFRDAAHDMLTGDPNWIEEAVAYAWILEIDYD
jgi:hypothetical protein